MHFFGLPCPLTLQLQAKRFTSQETTQWEGQASLHTNDVLIRTGVELGKVDILLGVKVCRGFVRHVDSTITKMYADEEQVFALQSIIRKRPVPARLQGSQAAVESDVPTSALLQEGQKVGMLGSGVALAVR